MGGEADANLHTSDSSSGSKRVRRTICKRGRELVVEIPGMSPIVAGTFDTDSGRLALVQAAESAVRLRLSPREN